MSWDKDIKEIKQREKLSLQQGGKAAVEKQHNKGRKTLRERIEFILDKNSFDEIGKIAGWLIEYCGWKGYREKSVAVSEDHALVLINIGGATGKTILNLAEKIKCSVMDEFDIGLEIEPRIVRN